jgi:putative peptidoglycan lipid II flippase
MTRAAGNTFSYAMGLVTFITVPSMLGRIVLREPIMAALFERGAFTPGTTRLTAQALLYYCIGLWAAAASVCRFPELEMVRNVVCRKETQ